MVENAQFPPSQKLIRKNVGYELDLPEYFFSGTAAGLKKHHRAFCRTLLPVHIPEANRSQWPGILAALHRVGKRPIGKKKMEIPAVRARDHRHPLDNLKSNASSPFRSQCGQTLKFRN